MPYDAWEAGLTDNNLAVIVCLVLLAEGPLRGLLNEDRTEELLNPSEFYKPLNLLELVNGYEEKKTKLVAELGRKKEEKRVHEAKFWPNQLVARGIATAGSECWGR